MFYPNKRGPPSKPSDMILIRYDNRSIKFILVASMGIILFRKNIKFDKNKRK